MMERLRAAVDTLSRIRGVRGALVVEKEAAVPVVAELDDGVNGTAVAALTASLFRRSVQAGDVMQLGALATLQLEADAGHVVAVDAGEMILVAVTERDAQIGLIRMEALRLGQSLT
jgi:predicted regulator of Ras-like GTPase activity (Roadblock/LC7/MglB family)